jgi:hypothetical protein
VLSCDLLPPGDGILRVVLDRRVDGVDPLVGGRRERDHVRGGVLATSEFRSFVRQSGTRRWIGAPRGIPLTPY